MDDEIQRLDEKGVWEAFKKNFIQTPGTSLLGLGQTGAGKTQKAYQITKYLAEAGETVVWIESGKSGEILPLLDFGLPVRVIYPQGVTMSVIHPTADIEMLPVSSPGKVWDLVKPGYLHILSFRQFFYLVQGYGRYVAEVFDSLIRNAFDRNIPSGLAVICDEFSNVCPGHELQLSKSMMTSAIKIAFALKNLRSLGIRLCAFDQSWTDVFPPARKQFPFYLLCRSPGIPKNVEILSDYRYAFRKLKVWQGIMVFPQYSWDGIWKFPLFKPAPGAKVDWYGKARFKYNILKDEYGDGEIEVIEDIKDLQMKIPRQVKPAAQPSLTAEANSEFNAWVSRMMKDPEFLKTMKEKYEGVKQ